VLEFIYTMPKEIRAIWDWLKTPEMSAGKITLVTILSGAIVTVMTFGAYFQLGAGWVMAATGTSTVQTSVTVLNVPPVWTFNAHEYVASATSTPTQSGWTLQFAAVGTDSNGDNYYLLICYGTSTTAAPTAGASGAPPTCGSGALQWAISPYTTSGSVAIAATTTKETFPFNQESNNWYGWVCDAAASNPSCNAAYTNSDNTDTDNNTAHGHSGTGTQYPDSNSPFVINHPPVFSFISTSSAVLPGGTVTWTATATDTDTIVPGGEVIQLWICKAQDFATSTCGAGGTWASSTITHFNPSTSTVIAIPAQDHTYNAYAYIQDTRGHQATSTLQASNTTFTVLNATPTVSSVTFISTSSATDIQLFRPHATSGPYEVHFTVTDTNGCQNYAGGNEDAFASTSVYRSAMSTCISSTTINTNMCYPSADPQTQIVCTQDTTGGGQCVNFDGNHTPGSGGSTATWTCKVPIWYNADPTDAGSVFAGQSWKATVQAADDNFATSTVPVTSAGTTMDKFLAFSVSTTSIAYGGLQPGQSTSGNFHENTDLNEWGNTGIDEMLYGDTMCVGWTSFGSCDNGGAVASSSQIASWNQQAATSTVPFNDPKTYPLHASSTPLVIALGVPKTTSTSSPNTKNTYWGIHIPIEITTSGAYIGQNVIGAVVSNSNYW
jgi:hypothetical protein